MPESDFQQKNTEIRRSTISVNGCTPAYVHRYLTTAPAFVSFRIQAPAGARAGSGIVLPRYSQAPAAGSGIFCRVTRLKHARWIPYGKRPFAAEMRARNETLEPGTDPAVGNPAVGSPAVAAIWLPRP